MPECNNCKSFVSQAYHRVFSVEGRLNACQNCTESLITDEEALTGT